MRQVGLFLSRFLLGLWIVFISAFLSLLLSNAPSVPDYTPFAGVSINVGENSKIHLPNRIFECTQADREFKCQTKIQDRLLDISFIQGNINKYDLTNCRASYDGQIIGCQERGSNHAPLLSKIYEITNLGLSSQQLQALKQKYWGMNFLVELGENRLLSLGNILFVVGGGIVGFFSWFHPSPVNKIFASFVCGFGVYHLVWHFFARIPYEIVIPYGFAADTWGWFIDGTAIAAGLAIMFNTTLLLWGIFNRLTQIPMGIASGVGIFNICWLSINGILTYALDRIGVVSTQSLGLTLFAIAIMATIFAIATAILLWSRTDESIKSFLVISNGFGVTGLGTYGLVLLLLYLGYVD
ncbi:hypothetical protein BC008_40590 [Mastigocoleus testarum BC008]|uniref:Uncharacterized protein n=2 Tax=Mastigocoleus TaxID=996924 RepID=A0A0V7ZH39_9CYAN|nr:hypothetical protein BC008_39615 [Mastigocoleus testarum BC008]KST64624.1 hypothetical protein BC008_40590 [Mastigocoleus testarum BC008]